jgi:hypothetical protein
MIHVKSQSQRMPNSRIWNVLISALLLLSAACSSPQAKIEGHLDNLRQQWESNINYQANLPEWVLNWPSAVDVMIANNLKLRQSRNDITNAQESVRQIFKDFIPTLNLRAGISKYLVDVPDITFDDVNFSADSFFSVPGLVNFRARLYAAQLYEIRVRAANELAEREQMIELYRLFFMAEELRDQTARLEMQRATAQAMEQIDPFTGRVMLTELETLELARAREAKGLQDRLSELLGSRDYKWVLSTNGLPDLRYQEHPLPLTDTNRVAQLQMKLLAVELEAARAQLLGLKLRYWPDLNIFISGPPIYARSGGSERFWDADELRASADVFWNIDTRGTLSRAIRQTKRQQELQKERYRQESLALMNRLMFTQQLIDTVKLQLERVEGQLSILLAIPPAQNYPALEKYSQDYRNLTQQQLQLKRELSELNALFWFVDEFAWHTNNSNTLLAPST